jgi:HK97 family phage major capsid protein
MSKVLELREKRAKAWEAAKAFLDAKSVDGAFVSGEDTATYEKMENEVMDLGKQIDRLERKAAIETEMRSATAAPITNIPKAGFTGDEKTGRASADYKRAFWNSMRNKMSYEVQNALTIGSDSEGGFLVPDEYEKQLVEALGEEVFFRGLATVIRTSSGDRKIPIVTSKGEAAWIDEGGQFPESDDSFGQTSIGAYKLATMIKVSDELLNDNVFNIEAYISKEFGRRIGTKEEEAFFIGNGTGKPVGIFHTTGGADTGVTVAGASISFDDVMDLYYSLRAPYRNKASWLLNDSTVKTIRKLKDGNGNYIWQPSVREGEPDKILNRPYRTSIYVPELAAGNRVMSFGDYSYYWIADRQGRSFKRLNELFATTGQVGFLASERVDGKLILSEAIKTLDVKAKTTT